MSPLPPLPEHNLGYPPPRFSAFVPTIIVQTPRTEAVMEAGTCSPLLMKTHGTGLLRYPTASKEPVPPCSPPAGDALLSPRTSPE